MAINMSKSRVEISYDSGSHSDTSEDDELENNSETGETPEAVEDQHSSPRDSEENEDSDEDGSDSEEDDFEKEDDGDDEEEDEEDEEEHTSGLANVMAKILQKKTDKKAVILAKGQTDREIQNKKRQKEAEEEEEGGIKKNKTEDSENKPFVSERERIQKRKLWEEMGRVKPNVLQKERERGLQRTATRGVVQLFNAVRKQQKSVEEKLKEVGKSELKRDHVLKSLNKGDFLDILKNTTPNVEASGIPTIKKEVEEPAAEGSDEPPAWDILREDFMMGAKMKDWDKESEDGDTQHDTQQGPQPEHSTDEEDDT